MIATMHGEKAARSEVEEPSAPVVGVLPEAGTAASRRPLALPFVRRLADELGVDLSIISGTGPLGRITEQDVRGAASTRPTVRVPMSRLRRIISENLSRSWREIPHVTTYGYADSDPLLAERERLGKPPVEALLIARLGPVLVRFPGDDILERRFYDIGFAVDTPDGLMVAVVRDADTLSMEELAGEVRRLAAGAKARTLQIDELRGQTFTVSNIGAVGGGWGTPIIPYGTSAILSVGRSERRPVVRGNRMEIGRQFPLSLSYDHRIIDGATGRRFMAAVIEVLES